MPGNESGSGGIKDCSPGAWVIHCLLKKAGIQANPATYVIC